LILIASAGVDAGIELQGKRFMKMAQAVLVALAIGAIFLFAGCSSPPREASIIAGFRAHRPTYERLRVYLQADEQLDRLADWGVVKTGSPVPRVPPDGGFPRERFKEYLSLLDEIHALGVSRADGPHPELCVLAWASGWAADTRHISVCWLDQVPSGLVSSIDDAKRKTDSPEGRRQFIYRRIEGNWYLEADR
jgi:hypothetical protein